MENLTLHDETAEVFNAELPDGFPHKQCLSVPLCCLSTSPFAALTIFLYVQLSSHVGCTVRHVLMAAWGPSPNEVCTVATLAAFGQPGVSPGFSLPQPAKRCSLVFSI